jgi:predicted permease
MTWLRRLFGHKRLERELDKELSYHIERRTADLIAAGIDPQEAAYRARLEFGGGDQIKETCRDTRGTRWVQDLFQDSRYALRAMGANKTFTVLAILSLALGIGANSAIFSFMDAILLRSLPVADPQSLVLLNWHTQGREMHGMNRHADTYNDPNGGFSGGVFAYPAFELFRRNETVFSNVFAYQGAGDLNLTMKHRAEIVKGEYISGDYFRGLGTAPAVGRLPAPDDDRAGASPVAAVSFAWSQSHFENPADAPGQSILINNTAFTIVGVTPPEFFGADPGTNPDIYLPMHSNILLEPPNASSPVAGRYFDTNFEWVDVMARLRPGVSAVQAQAALSGEFSTWMRDSNTRRRRSDLPTLVVNEGGSGLGGLRRQYSTPLYVLLTLVGLILTIACANISNLLLARAASRRREIAVRLSMGAGRLRVIRQLLTESILLALLGGAVGVAFAMWGIRFLTLLLANGRANFTMHADLNWHVLAVVAGLSMLSGLLFGLAPAIQSTRMDVMPGLKESRTGESRAHSFSGFSLSRILVVSQIAITLLIVVAAGLFLRTLSNLESIQLGFNRENVLTFQLNARQAGHVDPEIVGFYSDLQRQFAAIPGVRRASLSEVSLIGVGSFFTPVQANGAESKGSSQILVVGGGFFSTMQIPILLGREIDDRDQTTASMVAVVNEAFAKKNFGDQNPLGQHLTMPLDCGKCDAEIVGMVANSRYGQLTGTFSPVVYFPFGHRIFGPVQGMLYELRTAGNPLLYADTVREIVHRADERLPVSNLKTQSAWIDQTINQEITFARLCTAFAILALTIACVGLYGTMLYNVARRTGEIGIRMALGAHRGRVVSMVLREVLLLGGIGLAISVPAALAASRLVRSFLFETTPNDPLALGAAVGILAVAVTLAGYLPARRAARIEPTVALRHE